MTYRHCLASVGMLVLCAVGSPAHAADLGGHKTVILVSTSGERTEIADLELLPRYGGYGFEVTFRRGVFTETYMQETNFLCLPAPRRDICHFPFPPGDYTPDDSSGFFTTEDLRPLEYALLFAHKRPAPADIDINLFNGMYYQLAVVGKRIEGSVFGVDFNRLVVAGEKDKYPLKPGDLDPLDLKDERFPHLIIE